ncbi:cadherin-8-like [Talpa occidentalis]|uniref:cadherin-8-like n=1 Tax=Talpa occidentalis TaxID=50954 RepID=UPI0023F89EEC|nr:cadherin-8-like [Talpa occidentalis]
MSGFESTPTCLGACVWGNPGHIAHPSNIGSWRSKSMETVVYKHIQAANVRIDPRFSARGPFKDTATVKIVVEDADEPPVFSLPTYLLEVHENAALNSVIGQVTARDPDITSSPIRFSIDRHTDLERQFNINADDGKTTLATSLDRELSVWHNITIIATEIRNHSQILRVPVAIKVLDVNDNALEFASEYEAFLCENGKPGQVNISMLLMLNMSVALSRSLCAPVNQRSYSASFFINELNRL